MRRRNFYALTIAALSGIIAAILINNYTNAQYDWARRQVLNPPQAPTTTLVVATEDLAFGAAVQAEKLKEVPWPLESVPVGSYRSIKELFDEQQNRVVLSHLRGNEPVVSGKVTGPGQRAGLATMLDEGKKAVSIRVNDVVGVSGFLLPGDYVDLLLTQTGKEASESKKVENLEAYTSVLLEKIRVLAVDQTADPAQATPILARTITVEADLDQAKKITLASSVGNISAVLRKTGALGLAGDVGPVTVSQLAGDSGDNNKVSAFVPTNAVAEPTPSVSPEPAKEVRPSLAKVSIIRSVNASEYSVPRQFGFSQSDLGKSDQGE